MSGPEALELLEAVEKAGVTKGYTFTMFEEIWNYGFPYDPPKVSKPVDLWKKI